MVVVGEDATNGGVWCWPTAAASRPTSSAFFAISTWALMRSCSVGVRPVVGSVVTSPTEKMPNCMAVTLPGSWLNRELHDSTTGTGRLFRIRPSGARRGGDDDVAEVARAVPVLAGDEHQPSGDGLAEEPGGVLGDPALAVHADAGDGVPDGAAAGAHRHCVAPVEPLEVVERAAAGVDGVAGDERGAALGARPGSVGPPPELLR